MNRKIPEGGVILKPPPRLGDTVLLEPIARSMLSSGAFVGVDSPYSEIFKLQKWATNDKGKESVTIDLTGPWADENRVEQYYERIQKYGYKFGLCSFRPRLEKAVSVKSGRVKVGIIHSSADDYKRWNHWELLVEYLESQDYEVHAFDQYELLGKGIEHIGESLTFLCEQIQAMDYVLGNDTGPVHLAASLGIPCVAICGGSNGEKLYSPYGEGVKIIQAPDNRLERLSVSCVVAQIEPFLKSSHLELTESPGETRRIVVQQSKDIALMRLDGMGGTVTLLDQAKKVWQLTGKQVTLITRGFEDLLEPHPAVKMVRNVGKVDLFEATKVLRHSYRWLADVRIAVGKWYGRNTPKGWQEIESYYYEFPNRMVDLESYGLHQIQLANRTLGLDDETIEPEIHIAKGESPYNQPYALIATGIDAWHGGKRQTKQWDYFNDLNLPILTVQIGTRYDDKLDGAIDLRGKTSRVDLVGLIQHARAVLCCEGGIMHLAAACGHRNTIVLRGPTRGKLFEYPSLTYLDSHVCQPCWSKTDDWTWRCAKSVDSVCMKTITPERVVRAMEASI